MERNMSRQGQVLPPGITKRPPIAPREISQHDELIRYIHEAWNKVTIEHGPHEAPVFYESPPEPCLAAFTPFDLEGWWGRQLVQNIHISRGHQ